MPDLQNIDSPLTIIGNGRSGTSLVSLIFDWHSQCKYAGETVNLIHSVWKSMEYSLDPMKYPEIPEAIRSHFLKFFPSEHKFWMHKPIGIPIVWRFFPDEDEFCSWFWEVLFQVFPNGKYFTVLRHPLDVIVSSHQWWGWLMDDIINSNRLVAKIITHEKSQVNYAVNYHDLISNPEPQTRSLLEYLGVPFEERCMNAFKTGHVMSGVKDSKESSLANRQGQSFSHVNKWKEINPELITPAFREAVDACWAKFGFDFGGWPSEMLVPSSPLQSQND